MKDLSPAQILQQIAQIHRMEPGKLCVIGQGPNGSYYNLQCRQGGRNVSRYVPADQVQLAAQNTSNYEKFEGLVDQYAQIIVEQSRSERLAGSKKKTRPSSSSPRKKKSGG